MAKGKLNSSQNFSCDFSERSPQIAPDIEKINRSRKRKRVRRDTLFYLGNTKVQVKKKHRLSSSAITPSLPTSHTRPFERAVACANILCRSVTK
ncbi:hypothetical protein [Serratia marcescens]|uniref:hypothetical protein n=1 Tax=Serratia marcescens TaxID=615 RepID=UPI00316D00F5